MGRHCESKVNFCSSNPCLNGGVCSSVAQGHLCICAEVNIISVVFVSSCF
ncbi:hypothetical protein X975_21215, partial [Stegodyphus mimosarum]